MRSLQAAAESSRTSTLTHPPLLITIRQSPCKAKKTQCRQIQNKNLTIKKIFKNNKENQTSQVNEFSAFLNMGRCKILGLMKSFL